MKHRTCTIDGKPCASLVELRAILKCKRGSVEEYARRHGLEFDYKGHRVVLADPLPYHKREDVEDYVSDPPRRVARPPADFLSRAQAARRNYDERGVARMGLLNRRPA
jgi:hypothetical protein